MVCLHKLVVIFAAFICSVKGRAVNISNTWVLPEEGFPVFYRYFRDRISWYEADAVCQFHHGNLVTVDTTTQFDAVRAYLKELDIVNNVWIGLTRPSDKTTFSWSAGPLSGEGFWGEASALAGIAVCAATDPAADFRWHALTCGGPEVASFICELPVPAWALGANGCMLTSLPSLTVIYLPEQTALELTSDCGLDGTKRIACKGKADQQEMMGQLSCGITREDFDDKAVSKAPPQSTTASEGHSNSAGSSRTAAAATKTWIWTSNTIDSSEYGSPTRHRRETEDTYSTAAGGLSSTTETTTTRKLVTGHPTPETNRQRPSTRAAEPLTTSTAETSSTEDSPSAGGEFPSSINQGQLFSIIENGTLFDIIEVNDTSDSDLKVEKTTLTTTTTTTPTTTTTTTTTTEYSKLLVKGKSPNDLLTNGGGQNEKTFMKAIEIEAFPLNTSSLVKLNRTNRKELPMPVDTTEHTEFKQIDRDFTIAESATAKSTEDDAKHEHKIVEITITDIERKSDATKLYVTTKKYDKARGNAKKKDASGGKAAKKNLTAATDTIDSEMPLAENVTDAENNSTTELYVDSKVGDVNEQTRSGVARTTEEPLEPIPEAQPRPNRNRVLTRPQRRSFYPYFFSRVLG